MPALPDIPESELATACGGRITAPEKFPEAIHQGKRVFFCSSSCLAAFENDPERFMAGEIEHPED